MMHDIIQATFGWTDSHLFEFEVGNRVYGNPMPDDDDFGSKIYKAKSICLKTLVERGVERFLYVYDFGDNWRHDVVIEEVRDGDAGIDYPSFVDGARAARPRMSAVPMASWSFLKRCLIRATKSTNA